MTTTRECDVLVLGAGPAGIAAAVRAKHAAPNARVIVLDSGRSPGGQIWRASARRAPRGQHRLWQDRLVAAGAEVVNRATVYDLRCSAAGGFTAYAEREARPQRFVAHQVVLATGARELFLPFPGWTLPGVVGVGGLQALLKSGVDLRGKRVVIAGSGPLLIAVAASVRRAGARVVLVAEQASKRAVAAYLAGLWTRPGVLLRAVAYRAALGRASYRMGAWPVRAHGDVCVRAVDVADGRGKRSYDCDYLAMGFGLVPNTEMARLAGAQVNVDGVVVDAQQQTSVPGLYAAGEPTGIGGVDLAIAEGEVAGFAVAGRADLAARCHSRRDRRKRDALRLAAAFQLRDELRALARSDTTVCRCEDVALGDVHHDWAARQAKLYTRTGMGACQGRVCGPALHFLYGWTPDSVRPPTHAVLVSTLASADPPPPSIATHGAPS